MYGPKYVLVSICLILCIYIIYIYKGVGGRSRLAGKGANNKQPNDTFWSSGGLAVKRLFFCAFLYRLLQVCESKRKAHESTTHRRCPAPKSWALTRSVARPGQNGRLQGLSLVWKCWTGQSASSSQNKHLGCVEGVRPKIGPRLKIWEAFDPGIYDGVPIWGQVSGPLIEGEPHLPNLQRH